MRAFVIAALLGTAALAADPKYEYKDPAAPPPVDVKKPTIWKANLTLGLVWLSGNTESVGFSSTGNFSVKHYNNEFGLNVGGAFVFAGFSKYGPGGPVSDEDRKLAAGNWLIKARYDRYFLVKNTFFATMQIDGNTFAGYEHRIEPQIGYARIFFQSPRQMFKGEIGYDYTHEKRLLTPTITRKCISGYGEEDCQVVDYHSGRLFLFYENKFTPYASFSEGLEMLEAFNRLQSFRLNSLTTLSSTISKWVSLKLNFKITYNNDPPPRPAPTNIDPATMMLYVYPPDQMSFNKLDTQLDVVIAVTFL
jgi:putative salt-induced outer membrane protein YdiY